MDAIELTNKLQSAGSREEKVSLLDSYAEELFEKGSYKEAAQYFAQALSLEKQPNVKAYLSGQIGICLYRSGQDQDALKNLIRAARLFEPDKPEFMPDMCGLVYFYLGSLFEYHGKLAKSLEARRICEQYVDSQEKDVKWMLYAGLSRTYEAFGRHDEAIRYSQNAIQVLSDNDPGLAYLYETMGKNYESLKQYQEAIKHYSKVMELDPRFERLDEIHLRLANCYNALTNYRLAAQTYEKLLELKQVTGSKDELTDLYLKLANCQFRLGSYERSLLMSLEGLRRQPRSRNTKAAIRSFITNSYYELGRFHEAVQEGTKTLELARRFPNDDLFYFRMALSYHKLGDRKSFSKFRTLCRRLFPQDSWNKQLSKLA